MDSTTLMVTVLSMVGVRLPVLIALCVGLVWVVGAPRDATRHRRAGRPAAVAAVQPGWPGGGHAADVAGQQRQLQRHLGHERHLRRGALALAMVEAIGVVLLVWALVRMLRSRPAPVA